MRGRAGPPAPLAFSAQSARGSRHGQPERQGVLDYSDGRVGRMLGESRAYVMADLGRDDRACRSDGGRRKPRCSPCPGEEAAGSSLLGVVGSLSTTSSPAAAATKRRLVQGCRNIGGREGSERATMVATPSWPRAPDAAPRSTLPTTASRQVGLTLCLGKKTDVPISESVTALWRGPFCRQKKVPEEGLEPPTRGL